jgi:hypothetical protein
MQDMVGDPVPTEKEIEALVAQIQGIEAKLERYTVLLTAEQRKATTKMRSGGETIVPKVGVLATEHGVALPGVSVDGMLADLALAQRLAPLSAAIQGLQRRVDDTVLEAQSECWWAATALYSALARASGATPKLEASLRPIVEFFAVGRRVKKGPENK